MIISAERKDTVKTFNCTTQLTYFYDIHCTFLIRNTYTYNATSNTLLIHSPLIKQFFQLKITIINLLSCYFK